MSKLGKEGTKWSFLNCLSWIIKQTMNSIVFLNAKKEENVGETSVAKNGGF